MERETKIFDGGLTGGKEKTLKGRRTPPFFCFSSPPPPPPARAESCFRSTGHAAAFPVKLPSFFVQAYSSKGDRWLDPFLGSGTTMVAAEQLGRPCYGIEIEPKYCDIIVRRYIATAGKDSVSKKIADRYCVKEVTA